MPPSPLIRKRLAILGSTGSVGSQTLAVVEALTRAGHAFSVVALAAGKNLELLAAQAQRFQPKLIAIERAKDLSKLRRLVGTFWSGEIVVGEEGLIAAATHPDADLIVNALVGALGLIPTLEALKAKKIVALANKESLVIGGHLVHGVQSKRSLIPIDSEHSALFQLMHSLHPSEIERIILTASGGPFRTRPLDSFAQITVAEALQHPTWQMGKRITIDSATLVNKAFEVIEAHWLFDLPYEKISVLIHPQSVVHGLVELTDGSILAHLSTTDMKLPIQYALTYPERVPSSVARLDLVKQKLEFAPVGRERYPAFWLVCEAGQRGGTFPAVANAADEVFVQRFLKNEIPFVGIARGIERVLAEHEGVPTPALEEILEADRWARQRASEFPPNSLS
ncbi:MAG: 1-deoxy-D-xylulose-5-phosphate reductoisomerase [Candidatus Bipolaricaulota bacterium]|nr:1-deoxy-D-xylulose-5-phosphate reductoisomerase [Candidatus Bipolaricaulota bacterium]MDW8031165.1 1-deoxy-D-xylulose-5-phosphate reductoisomerase [Candidatus Bipolaricaulota bacterium]